jgi:hypothetical protein
MVVTGYPPATGWNITGSLSLYVVRGSSMISVNSYRLWLVVIILGVLALRLYTLTYQSLF